MARALEPLDAMLRTVTEPHVGFFLPEIRRLRAQCLLRQGPASFDGAIREFEAAIATARHQQARTFELRAAIGLARAWAAHGTAGNGARHCGRSSGRSVTVMARMSWVLRERCWRGWGELSLLPWVRF